MSSSKRNDKSIYEGTPMVDGGASGKLLASNIELSFWGGIDPRTGEIIDRHHPLSGECITDTFLAIPSGRGSSTGSAIILELMLSGNAPRGLIFARHEDILTLGVIVAEEIFNIKPIPVLVLSPEDFQKILDTRYVHIDGNVVLAADSLENLTASSPILGVSRPETPKICLRLTERDEDHLSGLHGEAARSAMRIITRMANLQGARELIDVSQVHIDGCIYTGTGSLAFAEKLRDLGGTVVVPTTLNSISIDQRHWRAQGVDPAFGEAAQKLASAYTDMGAQPTFTCAPYLLDIAPKSGDQIAWAESNAVVYANSVLGAKSQKYPDFLDAAIALTGRAPNVGLHLDQNRHSTLLVRVREMSTKDIDDSFYPLLGYYVGGLAGSRIPLITGLERSKISTDNLKAFSAAYGTAASAPMFHMLGITPEANMLGDGIPDVETVEVALRDVENCRTALNTAKEYETVDFVSFGSPHFSLTEIKNLSKLCRGRTKRDEVTVMVTCARSTYSLAIQAGYVAELNNFGVRFINDTCWCMISEPLIPVTVRVVMTNSAKYAHYGPGMTGKRFRFGSVFACVEAASEKSG